MLPKLNMREKKIFYACAALIIAFGIHRFIITPLQEQQANIADQILVKQSKLAKNEAIIRSAKAVEERYQKLLNIWGTAASEGVEASRIVAKLESAAKEANIHIANMQPQRAMTKDMVRVFPVELVVDGKWSSIVKFLYLIQSPPNLFDVQQMNLEKYSDTANSLRGSIVVTRTRVAPAAK